MGSAKRFNGSSCEATRAEHVKMNNSLKCSRQDPDGYLYIMDSCLSHLIALQTTRGSKPTDNTNTSCSKLFHRITRLFTKLIWRGETSAFVDIRRTVVAFYAESLARSRSDSCRDIAGRGAAIQTMVRDREASSVTFVIVSVTSKVSAPSTPSARQQQNGGQQPQQRE